MNFDFDVAVVGAGPVGLTLALLLARKGHQVGLLERWPAPYPLPRAVGLDSESLRVFHQGGADRRVHEVLEFHSNLEAHYITADGEILLRAPVKAVSESGFPEMMTFNQPDVETYLSELVSDHANIRVLRNVVVDDLRQLDGGAEVQYHRGNGNGEPLTGEPAQHVRARFVVGCDGANSFVASRLGASWTDIEFHQDWLVVDFRPTVERQWAPFLAQVLDPKRPTTIAPSGPGRRRFEFMLLPGETRESISAPDSVWGLMAQWGVNPQNAELVRSAVYRFRGRWADNWRNGRVLVAGDAAHLTPPFMGQGLNSGVRDSANLAMYLDLVLRGVSPESVLDHYTEERAPHVEALIRRAVDLGQQACITDPDLARERDDALRAFRDSGVPIQMERVPIVGGVIAGNDPLAGTLSYQGRVEREEHQGLFDDVCGSGAFTLIALGADPAAGLGPHARAIWNKLGGTDFHIGEGGWHDVDGVYTNWLSAAGARVVLVRPDYYVFGSGQSVTDADRLVIDLGRKLGIAAA